MSKSAWSALADRFAALAKEQEFRLAVHPLNSPDIFGEDGERFRFVYPFEGPPEAPTAIAALLGVGVKQQEEFVRINRLRWLSWAAGWLVGSDRRASPEVSWWRHLREAFPDRAQAGAPGHSALPAVAQLCADAARRLAESNGLTPTRPRPKLDNWASFQAGFRVLRERFNSDSWHMARPDAAIVAAPDHYAYDSWYRATVERAMQGRTEPRAWAANGSVWGDPDAVNGFVGLANDAGIALPLELTLTPPLFPWFNCIANSNCPPESLWLEFLFLTYPPAFTQRDDHPASGCRIARLNTSPRP